MFGHSAEQLRRCSNESSQLTKHWSSAQKGGIFTEAFGIQSVGRDLGLSTTLGVHTDSAAAVGICKRAGIGRGRQLAEKTMGLFKVHRDANPADALTKYLSREVLDRHVAASSLSGPER